MIKERTVLLTLYNAYCDHCDARGPDAFNEVDAHIFARQVGWEIIGDSYVCNNPKHSRLKTMRDFLVEIKQQSKEGNSADNPI